MIRLFTLAGGGEAYLNFMGNEFGHPEWIDFPREGNGWDFKHCRRQWSLCHNGFLKYGWLSDFDKDMIKVTKENHIFKQKMPDLLLMKEPEQTIVFYRHGLIFEFNFSPTISLTNVLVPVPHKSDYTVLFCSDDFKYGGNGNVAHMTYPVKKFNNKYFIELYIPARTAIVFKENIK